MKLKRKTADEDFRIGEVVEADFAQGMDGKIVIKANAKAGGSHIFYYKNREEFDEEWGETRAGLLEEVCTMLLVLIYIVGLTICWVCAIIVSTDIFLPFALLLSALAGVIMIGAFISASDNKKGKK